MELILIAGAVFFAVTVALVYTKCFGPRKPKQQKKRATREPREEFQIDPNNVPEFHPTWQDPK